jgi:hypothetical protein
LERDRDLEAFIRPKGKDMRKDMRIAALPVALLSIVVGIAGIASPEGGMTLRRLYFATPSLFYTVVAIRSAMGLGLILAASSCLWSRSLRALGAVVCLQGLSATLLGLEHARAIMEWEAMQGTALLRAGAAVALASGGFIVFAVTQGPSDRHLFQDPTKPPPSYIPTSDPRTTDVDGTLRQRNRSGT